MARTLFFMKRHSLLILGLVLVGTMTLAALLARAHLMKAMVGMTEIRPITVKIASLAQKKGLAS